MPEKTDWQPFDGPLIVRPTSKDLINVFGNPSNKGVEDRQWVKDNIVAFHGANALPGTNPNAWLQVHRVIVPYLTEALRRAAIGAPGYKIEVIVGYVFRHMRHDPNLPLSNHSFGIAVDINPKKNFAQTLKKTPAAWSDEWKSMYPNGVTPGLVAAFTSCGFAWGSDWDEDGLAQDHTYCDPMHFEFVERGGHRFV